MENQKKNIVIMTEGTRGDIQPFAILGRALMDRGYRVRFVTSERCKYVVDQYGLDLFAIPGSIGEILSRDDVVEKLKQNDPMYAMNLRKKMDKEELPERLKRLAESVEGMDLIISSAMTISEGHLLGKKLGIPNVMVSLQPNLPTSSMANMMLTRRNFWLGFLNRLTYTVFDVVYGKYENDRLEEFLKHIDHQPRPLPWNYLSQFVSDPDQVVLAAVDPLAMPGQQIPSDYLPKWKMVGFLYPQNVQNSMTPVIPQKILTFLDSGDAPVVFSLGSMRAPRDDIMPLVLRAVQRLGLRLIVLSNWSSYPDLQESEKVIMCDNVDHSWLYPRCKVIIHHGGVGSMAAALVSGTPSICTWMYADQPYFGDRIAELGCGRSHSLHTLTERDLFASLLELTTNTLYKQRALAVSDRLKATNAASVIVDTIDSLLHPSNQQQKQQQQHQEQE